MIKLLFAVLSSTALFSVVAAGSARAATSAPERSARRSRKPFAEARYALTFGKYRATSTSSIWSGSRNASA
jgi:hypothetical protein